MCSFKDRWDSEEGTGKTLSTGSLGVLGSATWVGKTLLLGLNTLSCGQHLPSSGWVSWTIPAPLIHLPNG